MGYAWEVGCSPRQLESIRCSPNCSNFEDDFHMTWCVGREINNLSSKDKEYSLEDLSSLFFNMLFLWTMAIDFNGLNVHDLLVAVSFFFSTRCIFCICPMHLCFT